MYFSHSLLKNLNSLGTTTKEAKVLPWAKSFLFLESSISYSVLQKYTTCFRAAKKMTPPASIEDRNPKKGCSYNHYIEQGDFKLFEKTCTSLCYLLKKNLLTFAGYRQCQNQRSHHWDTQSHQGKDKLT
jgi:hypothetical protein